MKRVFIFLFVLVILTSLPILSFAKTNMLIGIVIVPGSAKYICVEKFKEIVEAEAGWIFSFEIKHSASLGSDSSIIQQFKWEQSRLQS